MNFVQKHTRANPQKNIKGGILPKEASIHLSNLMVVCKRCNKHARVGFRGCRTDAKSGFARTATSFWMNRERRSCKDRT